MKAQARTCRWWAVLTLVILLAFGLRVWSLPQVPPGITHDEASNGHDAAAILQGEHRIYFPVGYGHEPLYNYSVALVTAFAGQSIFSLRFTTVLWGMGQLVLAVALARRWWGRTAAVAVAAAYTASFWSLMLSRVGLRAPALPALLTASVYCYVHAVPSGHPQESALGTRHGDKSLPSLLGGSPGEQRGRLPRRVPPAVAYVASGLFLGASLYTYMASRGMPLLYVVYLIALILTDRPKFRGVWQGTLALLLIAAAISAPLFIHLHRNPHLEQRIGQLGQAITAAQLGNWQPLLKNLADSAPMLFLKADPQWLYNIAGRPGLEPLLVCGLLAGLAYAVGHIRRASVLLSLIWLVGGLAPALLVTVDYNLLHAIAAMPAVMLLIGAGAAWISRGLHHLERPAFAGATALTLIAFTWMWTVVGTARAYFVTWAENRDVRVAYHHHVVALGRHLEGSTDATPAVITTLYPGEVHDPYAMEMALRSDDRQLRWVDGRWALFIPSSITNLYIEEQTQPVDELWSYIAPDLEEGVTLRFRENDIPTQTTEYTWHTSATWQRLKATTVQRTYIAAGDPPPSTPHRQVDQPIPFGRSVVLIGHSWLNQAPDHEGKSDLLTLWEVTDGAPEDLTIFAHLIARDGELVAQSDRLDAPSWQWRPGDRFVQRHRLRPSQGISDDAYRDAYGVALGLYTTATLERLPVDPAIVTQPPGATRVLIPLETPQ